MTSADVETWLRSLSENAVKLSSDCFEKWCREISRRYSEKWRFYHTLKHISDMMTQFGRWRNNIRDRDAVVLAILFHDVVYEPKSATNELDSVKVFQDFASEACLDEKLANRVERLITATIKHLPDDQSSDDRDLAFFLDFDMAILGQSEQEYDLYAADIKAEYCHLEEEAFRTGRAKVLQTFLKRDKIYATTEFQNQYEDAARKNIQREIQRLIL